MDEDCEIIKDNEDNRNKLNISNKRAELSYTGPERDGEDLVQNIVNIRTDSTVHWWLTFTTTGNSAGLRVQQGG